MIRGNAIMNSLSPLEQVTAELESSVNLTRMKKLLYFVLYGKWEVNEHKLTELELKDILTEIIGLNYSLEQLEGLLKDICSKINKQVEYLAISDEIIKKIAPLYLNSAPILSTVSDSLNRDNSTENGLATYQQSTILTKYDVEEKKQVKQDLLEVRLKLVQRTNPLRVKILIFSAMHHLFTFSEADWLALKKYRLDELLEKILQKCPRKKDLENLLYQTAKKFENKNENIQVASAIVKYLGPLYEKNASELLQPQGGEQSTGNLANALPEKPVQEYAESSNIMALNQPENELAIAALNNGYSPAEPPTNSINSTNSLPSGSDFPELAYHHSGQIYAEEDEITIPELHSNLPEHCSEEIDFLPKKYGDDLVKFSSSYSAITTKFSPKITESLKQHLLVEEAINQLVSLQVSRVMEVMEKSLSELEQILDERLENQTYLQAAALKYNSLKQMISQIEAKTSKYLDLLNQMQQAEMQELKTLNPEASADKKPAKSAEPAAEERDDDSEAKVLQLAKEGNAKAIATLMNNLLKGRGIHVLATIKNDWLHIVLESEKELNQKASINVVRKNLVPLEIAGINKVKVHWRKTGSKSPAWSQEFNYLAGF